MPHDTADSLALEPANGALGTVDAMEAEALALRTLRFPGGGGTKLTLEW